MLLGLDISTSIIGWCLLDGEGSYIDIGYVNLSKEKDFYVKCNIFKSFLETLPESISDVYIEEAAKVYNKSRAHTIILLQRFNAVCCFLVNLILEKKPELIMASSARKLAGIKIPKEIRQQKGTKGFVLNHLKSLDVVPEGKWQNKKTGKPKDWCFDQADAWVVATAGRIKRER